MDVKTKQIYLVTDTNEKAFYVLTCINESSYIDKVEKDNESFYTIKWLKKIGVKDIN